MTESSSPIVVDSFLYPGPEGANIGVDPGYARPGTRLVHLDVEDCSEELLRKQSYAIKNQLDSSKAPY